MAALNRCRPPKSRKCRGWVDPLIPPRPFPRTTPVVKLQPTQTPTQTPAPSACVEPYSDVQACVHETLEELGMAWALRTWDCIISHESGWNRYAVGGAGERGLTQVHPVWFGTFDASKLYEPDYNIRAAVTIYGLQGWRAWSVHWKCGV